MNIYIPSITDKHLEECKKCNNKCKNCPLRGNCEFDWIYRLGNTEPELMGNWFSGDQKAVIRGSHAAKNQFIIATDDHKAFLHYQVCPKMGYVRIGHACVDKNTRGQGHGSLLVQYVVDHAELPIVVTCIADTSADSFWKHMTEKYGGKLREQKPSSIGKVENTYQFGEDKTAADKEDLW